MSDNSRLNQLMGMFENTPNDCFLLFAIAKEYERKGEVKESLNFYQKIIEIDTNYSGVYYHLGKLLEAMNEKAKALAIYKQGIEVTTQLGDRHARSELQNAKMNLEMEDLLS